MSASQAASLSESARFQILLRVRHPNMDPALITHTLAIEPEHTFRAGQPRRAGAGSGVHAESLWLGALRPEEWSDRAQTGTSLLLAQTAGVRRTLGGDLGFALQICLGSLRRHAALFRRIDAEGGQAKLLVELDTSRLSGFALAAPTLQVLSELALGVEFEFAAAAEPARRSRAS